MFADDLLCQHVDSIHLSLLHLDLKGWDIFSMQLLQLSPMDAYKRNKFIRVELLYNVRYDRPGGEAVVKQGKESGVTQTRHTDESSIIGK